MIRIRRRPKNGPMLDLNKSTEKTTSNFRGQWELVYGDSGEQAEVKIQKQKIIIEFKDLGWEII